MDLADMEIADPREEIARLEQHIERLAAKVESCRKFVLASRITIAIGGALLVAAAFGAIRFNAPAMTAAIAAVLGGIVVLGSNRSTAKEATAEMAAAEAARSELIAGIELRVVSEESGARQDHPGRIVG
jgi:outer membrane biosynthesis protein TonB